MQAFKCKCWVQKSVMKWNSYGYWFSFKDDIWVQVAETSACKIEISIVSSASFGSKASTSILSECIDMTDCKNFLYKLPGTPFVLCKRQLTIPAWTIERRKVMESLGI